MVQVNRVLAGWWSVLIVMSLTCDSSHGVCLDPACAQSVQVDPSDSTGRSRRVRASQLVDALDRWHIDMLRLKLLQRFGTNEDEVRRMRRRRTLPDEHVDTDNNGDRHRIVSVYIESKQDAIPECTHTFAIAHDDLVALELQSAVVRVSHEWMSSNQSSVSQSVSVTVTSHLHFAHHRLRHSSTDHHDSRHNRTIVPVYCPSLSSSTCHYDVTHHLLPHHFSSRDALNWTVSVTFDRLNNTQCASLQPVLEIELKPESSSKHKRQSMPFLIGDQSRQTGIGDCSQKYNQRLLNDSTTEFQSTILPCCRRRVHINFDDLGWSNWILAPASFDSFYCLGRCRDFGGFAQAGTAGSALYADIRNQQNVMTAMGLVPCCSPVQFQPLTIMTARHDNERVSQTFDDVIVTQCGCM